MSTFQKTIKEVERIASDSTDLGLKDGLMKVVLFFFYYQRFTEDDRYEETAFNLLENILSKMSKNEDYDYANGIVGIGNTLLFLQREKFIDIDSSDFFDDLDKIVLGKLQSKIVINFSHDTGVIGLCRYAIQRPIKSEALQCTFSNLIKGFEKTIYDINPAFLFPSEILQDVKLFLLEIAEIKEAPEQIDELKQAIMCFEREYSILQSNCPEYTLIQQLREAEICNDKEKIQPMLVKIEKGQTNTVLKGLAYMSLGKNSLPSWWKLY
jgi:hypothetical protein